MTSELVVKNLTLYWEDVEVVSDISLSLERGQIGCLIGRSGSGKTTIFHALSGLTQPAQGSIAVAGHPISHPAKEVAYMQQKDLLLPWMTIEQNASLPLLCAGASKEAARRQIAQLLPTFGLEGTEEKFPVELSGGMRQRAALLRTFLENRPLFLFDEPFSALDAFTRHELRDWFYYFIKEHGLTAMFITHDIDEALTLADRVYVLSGDPMAGKVSRIAREVPIERKNEGKQSFELSERALMYKRKLLALLEQ